MYPIPYATTPINSHYSLPNLSASYHNIGRGNQYRLYSSKSGNNDDDCDKKEPSKERYTDNSDRDAEEYYRNYHRIVTGSDVIEATRSSRGEYDDAYKITSETTESGEEKAGDSFTKDAAESAWSHHEKYHMQSPTNGMIDAYELTSATQKQYEPKSSESERPFKDPRFTEIDMDYYNSYNQIFSPHPMLDANELTKDFSHGFQSPQDTTVKQEYIDTTAKQEHTHTSVRHNEEKLTHVDDQGFVEMVDVGDKTSTSRVAVATGHVQLSEKAFTLVKENKLKKGDVLTVSQIAGIMASKKTSSLIPLCHIVDINKCDLQVVLEEESRRVLLRCEVRSEGKTGVEMEALTGVSVAALTVYDMCKAVTQDIIIGEIKLLHKSGGQRGDYDRQN